MGPAACVRRPSRKQKSGVGFVLERRRSFFLDSSTANPQHVLILAVEPVDLGLSKPAIVCYCVERGDVALVNM